MPTRGLSADAGEERSPHERSTRNTRGILFQANERVRAAGSVPLPIASWFLLHSPVFQLFGCMMGRTLSHRGIWGAFDPGRGLWHVFKHAERVCWAGWPYRRNGFSRPRSGLRVEPYQGPWPSQWGEGCKDGCGTEPRVSRSLSHKPACRGRGHVRGGGVPGRQWHGRRDFRGVINLLNMEDRYAVGNGCEGSRQMTSAADLEPPPSQDSDRERPPMVLHRMGAPFREPPSAPPPAAACCSRGDTRRQGRTAEGPDTSQTRGEGSETGGGPPRLAGGARLLGSGVVRRAHRGVEEGAAPRAPPRPHAIQEPQGASSLFRGRPIRVTASGVGAANPRAAIFIYSHGHRKSSLPLPPPGLSHRQGGGGGPTRGIDPCALAPFAPAPIR